MKKLLFLVALCCAPFVSAHAQQGIFPGTGGNSGSVTGSIFYIASSCGGLTNCLTWIDNDTTDNCGPATTAFMTAINSYSGTGTPYVYIQGSGTGKAYKLTSCNLAFTGPPGTGGLAGSPVIISNATIDCAQTGGNCIQMGKTGCSTTVFYGTGCHDVTWRGGTFIGGVGLSTAVMEVEQGMYINVIDDVTFQNTGAGSATLGTCTNYSVKWGTFVGGIEFSRNKFWGSVGGQCFSQNIDATGGANTIIFTNNTISHAVPLAGGACGGILHSDSSMHSTIDNNTLYGFAVILDLVQAATATQEGGWLISGNNLDTSGCAIPSGQPASVQFGFPSNNAAVGPVTFINNNGYTTPLISQYFGSTATMQGWNITGNNTTVGGSALINPTAPCAAFGSSPCYLGANPGYPNNNVSSGANGARYPGFIVSQGNAGSAFAVTQTANLSATNINSTTTYVGGTSLVACQVILTRAATTSSSLPTCTINWTDGLTGVAETATITSTSAANTVGTQSSGTVYALVNAASNITVSTSGYTSVGATSMQYGLFADITKVY